MKVCRLWVTSAFCVATVIAWQSPAFAHGTASALITGVSRSNMRGIMSVLLGVETLLLWKFASSLRVLWSDGWELATIPAELRSKSRVAWWGLAWCSWLFGMILAILGPDADPFGMVPRVFVLFWPGLVMLSALFGRLWPLAGTKDVTSRSAVVALVVFVWYSTAFHDSQSHSSLALLLSAYGLYVVVGLARGDVADACAADPFGAVCRVVSAMSPFRLDEDNRVWLCLPGSGLVTRTANNTDSAVTLILLATVVFELLAHQSRWVSFVGATQGWDYTFVMSAALAVTLLSCVIGCLLACAACGYFSRVGVGRLIGQYGPALVPISVGLVVAHDLMPFLTALEDQLFTLWDPLGQGWDLFGTGRQGLTIQLTGNYLNAVELVGIFAGPALAMLVAFERARHACAPRDLAPVLFPAIGLIASLGFLCLHLVTA